jgi:hypothetical protein
MKKLIRCQKGITMTEVVIYIGVVALIGVGIVSMVLQLIQLKIRADSIGVIVSENTNLFEKMILDVRNCDSFNVADSSSLQVVKDGVTSQYVLDGSRVYFNDGENQYPLTSSLVEVTSLSFADWTSTSSDNFLHVEVEFRRGDLSENYQTSIHKR